MSHNVTLIGGAWLLATTSLGLYAAGAATPSQSGPRRHNIINMLDEIMDHMDGFSSAEEAWLSSITETLRTWRYVMHETTKARKKSKTTRSFIVVIFAVFLRCASWSSVRGSPDPYFFVSHGRGLLNLVGASPV
jgi:hypothetical protein